MLQGSGQDAKQLASFPSASLAAGPGFPATGASRGTTQNKFVLSEEASREVAGTRLVGGIALVSMSWPYSSLRNCLSRIFYLGAASKLSCLNKTVHRLVQNKSSFLLPLPEFLQE